ncbi:MAG: hypothetical protein JWQ98_2242 [Chlorobi bacterium]|jgi:hypothetical protein|nr:hypothetical protein [Chlorobiota bacterium]
MAMFAPVEIKAIPLFSQLEQENRLLIRDSGVGTRPASNTGPGR